MIYFFDPFVIYKSEENNKIHLTILETELESDVSFKSYLEIFQKFRKFLSYFIKNRIISINF